ncbi:MAG: hypothetical protein KAJ40_00365 [Alphaproteobacteria bacterium]|nr:hypothetical protein [Alphaproteobacteria bacterium]
MCKNGRLKTCVILALFLPLLGACPSGPYSYKLSAGLLYAASSGMFLDSQVNLKEKNYAAADFLQSKFGKTVSLNHVIKAQPLEELEHTGITSPLGRNISEGVGLRLSELGYSVLLQDVAPYDSQGLYPEPKYETTPHFVLKGFYTVNNDDVDIILHIVDTQNNNVVTRFDYKMSLSREIKKLVQTSPSVFRLQE